MIDEKKLSEWQALPEAIAEIRRLQAENEKIREEYRNEACGDAIERLWQKIIIRRKPNYGDWEYPGMAYRHLKAEFMEIEQELAEYKALGLSPDMLRSGYR